MVTSIQRNISNSETVASITPSSGWRKLVPSFSTVASLAALGFSYYTGFGSYLAYASGTLGSLGLTRNFFKKSHDPLQATARLPERTTDVYGKDDIWQGVQKLYDDLVFCGIDGSNKVTAIHRYNNLYDTIDALRRDPTFVVDENAAQKLFTIQSVLARNSLEETSQETAPFDMDRLYAVLLVNGLQDKARLSKKFAQLQAFNGLSVSTTSIIIEKALQEDDKSLAGPDTIGLHIQRLLINVQQGKINPNEARVAANALYQLLSYYLSNQGCLNENLAVDNLDRIYCLLEGRAPAPAPSSLSATSPSVPRPTHSEMEIIRMKQAYCGLGTEKWKEGVESGFHCYGHLVFDQGLHGGTVERGFHGSWLNGAKFLNENFQRRFSPQMYLDLHKILCQHFRGAENGTLMGQDKIGVFRSDSDPSAIEWYLGSGTYAVTPDAERELEAFNIIIQQRFGVTLGHFVPVGDGTKKLSYTTMPQATVGAIMQFFSDMYHNEIAQAQNPDQKLRAVCRLYRHMEWLHSVRDGCGRTDTQILNFNLCQQGFNPIIANHPYISNTIGEDAWVDYVKASMQNWRDLRQQIATA